MGFSLKKIVGVVAAPVTAPVKVLSNVIDNVADKTGLGNVPILGNVLSGASSALSVGYDATLGNKSSAEVNTGLKNAAILGSAVVTGGATLPVVAAAATYGGEAISGILPSNLSQNPGILDTLGGALGLDPGMLSAFLPKSSSGGSYRLPSGSDPVPTQDTVVYGVPGAQSPSIAPFLIIGGGLLVLVLLAKRRK